MTIRKLLNEWQDKDPVTTIIDHGANPGLVSHFTKYALIEIAEKILKEKPGDPRRGKLEKALVDKNFAKLAQTEGVKAIHISERDMQIADKPKQVNEFVNTWSIDSSKKALRLQSLGGAHTNATSPETHSSTRPVRKTKYASAP